MPVAGPVDRDLPVIRARTRAPTRHRRTARRAGGTAGKGHGERGPARPTGGPELAAVTAKERRHAAAGPARRPRAGHVPAMRPAEGSVDGAAAAAGAADAIGRRGDGAHLARRHPRPAQRPWIPAQRWGWERAGASGTDSARAGVCGSVPGEARTCQRAASANRRRPHRRAAGGPGDRAQRNLLPSRQHRVPAPRPPQVPRRWHRLLPPWPPPPQPPQQRQRRRAWDGGEGGSGWGRDGEGEGGRQGDGGTRSAGGIPRAPIGRSPPSSTWMTRMNDSDG